MDYKIYPTDGPHTRRVKQAYSQVSKEDRDKEPWMAAFISAACLDAKEKKECNSENSTPDSKIAPTKG